MTTNSHSKIKLRLPFKLVALLLFVAFGNSPLCAQLSLRFSPLSLLDNYSGPCLKLGAELGISNRWSITADIGHYLNYADFENNTGFLVDASIRRYFVEKELQGNYISVNVAYKQHGFNYWDTIPSLDPGRTIFRTQTYATHVNFNFGTVHFISDRLFLDAHVGLGVRFKSTGSSLTQAQLDEGLEYQDSQSRALTFTPGKMVLPNLNAGIKVGWRPF